MVKELLMKKLLVLSLVFACLTGKAQKAADSVVMTVAGKQVSLSEFVFIAEKNGEVNLSDKKSVKEYVELFKNFKLKVAEAEELGLDKTQAFQKELDEYRTQLTKGYLSDKTGEDAAVRAEYNRLSEIPEFSYILFRLPSKTLSKDTIAVYQRVLQVCKQIQDGGDLDEIGKRLAEEDKENIRYEYIPTLLPIQTFKSFEDVVYSMPVGSVSMPVRTAQGFHVIRLKSRRPNPGLIRVAQILIPFSKDSTLSVEQADMAALKRAEEVCNKIQSGADFAEMAKNYSSDYLSAQNGGALPVFGVDKMVKPFEEAAFAMATPGEVSRPVKTRFGYHIIKLIEKKGLPLFDEMKASWSGKMAFGEHSSEFYKTFDERLKNEYGYKFYPEAYAELQSLCSDYFPTDSVFYGRAKNMDKVLFHVADTDYPQSEFAYYLQCSPLTTKTYAGDFMEEAYSLFLREIMMIAERNNLTVKHPEFNHIMREYRDGILLFEISNDRVWSKPAAEQPALEAEWVRSLNEKYPVTVNWKLLKKFKK